MKNYNGKEVKLVCESTGVEKNIGDTVLSFRGELATIKFYAIHRTSRVQVVS